MRQIFVTCPFVTCAFVTCASFVLALPAFGQLVAPNAIPKGPNPPVVFLDGYQATCPGSFNGTFGSADKTLQAAAIASVFFDNCTVTVASGKPTIEAVAGAFGAFLAGLRYTDGTAVAQVDVVVHSMGGLVVRTWLAGQSSGFRLNLAAVPAVRKAVFLATPHFGSFLAPFATAGVISSVLGNDAQTLEMSPGSQFLLSLATWNGGLDDLAGVDAIAIAGNAGNGFESGGAAGFDDGVVSLTSASLGFIRPGRTRVISACHISNPALNLLCPQTAPAIADLSGASSPVTQIVTSFLTGTNAWQSIGTAIENVSTVASAGGLLLQFEDANGKPVPGASASVTTGSGSVSLTAGAAALYRESIPVAPNLPVVAKTSSGPANLNINLTAATSTAVISKPGPLVHGVVPAGSAVFPYDVAAGAYVAIYGSGFAAANSTATLPYPTTLGGVTVTVGGQPAALQFVSAGQLNIILPVLPSGPATLVVTNTAGSYTTTTVVAAAVPSIFSLDGSGTGPAAAINAATGKVIGPAAPLKNGSDYVELFLTGLGVTTTKSGLDYADAPVTLTIGGVNCPVTYAGRVPGVPGLDQVNCQVPAGISGSAVPAIVTAAGRASNTVTLAIQ